MEEKFTSDRSYNKGRATKLNEGREADCNEGRGTDCNEERGRLRLAGRGTRKFLSDHIDEERGRTTLVDFLLMF
jgi:hypothetical protein